MLRAGAVCARVILLTWLVLTGAVGAVIVSTGQTGNVSYHTTSTASETTIEWRITPAIAVASILLSFSDLNAPDGELHIFRGATDTTSKLEFSCVECRSGYRPPPFYIHDASVFVSLLMPATIGTNSFELHYIGVPQSLDDIETQLGGAFSFDIDLFIGMGTLRPIFVESVIPANESLAWRIEPDSSAVLTFSLGEAVLPDPCVTRLRIVNGTDHNESSLANGGNGGSLSPAQVAGQLPASDPAVLYDSCSETFEDDWIFAEAGSAFVLFDNFNHTHPSAANFSVYFVSDEELFECGDVVYPIPLTANTFQFRDGSSSNQFMRAGETCTWRIHPHSEAPVILILNRVSIKDGGHVIVYDGPDTAGLVLWDCDACARIIPPPLIGLPGSTSMFVVYSSNSFVANPFTGFEAVYYSDHRNSKGTGTQTVNLAMSSALSLRLPGDPRNGSVDPVLAPTNGPPSYPRSYVHRWIVEPSQALQGEITFIFNAISIADCENDSVRIYDGALGPEGGDPLLGSFCGETTPAAWVMSSGLAATILFSSGNDRQRNGSFDLAFVSDGPNYHCGFSTNPAVLTAPSFIFSDGSRSDETLYKGQRCEWLIEPSRERATDELVVVFERFSLGGGRLDIYDGEFARPSRRLLHADDRESVPAPVVSTSRKLYVVFRSDDSGVSGTGFHARYYTSSALWVGSGDGRIPLASPVVASLTLPTQEDSTYPRAWNQTWVIAPTDTSGGITFVFRSLQLPQNCGDTLTLYDGNSTQSPVLGTFCGDTTPTQWYQTSGAHALLVFESSNVSNTDHNGTFDVQYFSDGPALHCGHIGDPRIITESSMYFTDGSVSTQSMVEDEHCEWILYAVNKTTGEGLGGDALLFFPRLDLRSGASLRVYTYSAEAAASLVGKTTTDDNGGDGADDEDDTYFRVSNSTIEDSASLLWECNSCGRAPGVLRSPTGALHVIFETDTDAAAVDGTGFAASFVSSPFHLPKSFSGVFLEDTRTAAEHDIAVLDFEDDSLEEGLDDVLFSKNTVNATRSAASINGSISAVWEVVSPSSTDKASSLRLTPSMRARDQEAQTASATRNGAWYQYDHRLDEFRDVRRGSHGVRSYCGVLDLPAGEGNISMRALEGESILNDFQPVEYAMNTTRAREEFVRLKALSFDDQETAFARASPRCAWFLRTPGTQNQALMVRVQSTSLPNAELHVFGGITGGVLDAKLFSARNTSSVNDVTLEAPCGKATLVLMTNRTASERVPSGLDMTIEFKPVEGDSGRICAAYIKSLLPPEKKKPNYTLYFMGAAVLLLLGSAGGVYWYMHHDEDEDAGPGWASWIRYKFMSPHPRYSPAWDAIRNRFLKTGTCCVCMTEAPVFPLSTCVHVLCSDCLRSYIGTALGDISLFPVKCPMHFEGCLSSIGPDLSKRVLSRNEYDKFLEFNDRALFGEGLRCDFCSNFVSFPSAPALTSQQSRRPSLSMVSCPYCAMKFCVRCRKPWHPGIVCGTETDENLEGWRKKFGAQKCPACAKIIEKDDPDTCNHMVHKITDPIPCVRDRTDFCYMCGTEVTSEYPHEEMDNPGVNHFPDGVFQPCRMSKTTKRKKKKRNRRGSDAAGAYRVNGETGSKTGDSDSDSSDGDDIASQASGQRGQVAHHRAPETDIVYNPRPRPHRVAPEAENWDHWTSQRSYDNGRHR